MANIVEYIISAIDRTRAANASARYEIERTRQAADGANITTIQGGRNASREVKAFGAGWQAVMKVISYATMAVGVFMGAFKGTTAAMKWVDGITSGMAKFKAGLDAARAAHKELAAQLQEQGKLDMENLERKNKKGTETAQARQGYNTALGGLQGAYSSVAAAERAAQAEQDIAAGADPTERRAQLQRDNELQAKADAEREARLEAANARIAENDYNRKLANEKALYEEQARLKADADQKAADILAQNPSFAAVPADVESVWKGMTAANAFQAPVTMGTNIGNNMAAADRAALEGTFRQTAYKHYIEQKTRSESAAGMMAASGYNPDATQSDALRMDREAAEQKAKAAKTDIKTQADKNQNDIAQEAKEKAEQAKQQALEGNGKMVKSLTDSLGDYFDYVRNTFKKSLSEAERLTRKKLDSAEGKAGDAKEALTKAKERSEDAWKQYRDPEYRHAVEAGEKAKVKEEKQFQNDLQHVRDKLKTQAKWDPKLTKKEEAILKADEARKAEAQAQANYTAALNDVKQIRTQIDSFMNRAGTVG